MAPIPTTVKSKNLVKKRRKQIVLAGIKLFSQKGYHKATLRDIAKEAGLTHANIYHYVGNKEDIFVLIRDFLYDLLNEYQDRNLENIDDPIEKLRRLIKTEFDISYDWADATLLIYQEGHILSKTLLKKLLRSERDHVSKFEHPIEECIKDGRFRDCNVRLVANLIKIMIDAWVLKRWDLKGHTTQNEIENTILDLLFHGVLKEDKTAPRILGELKSLDGKSILLINGGTGLGTEISSFLNLKRARVAVYSQRIPKERGYTTEIHKQSDDIKVYSREQCGPMTESLLKRIFNELGSIDIIIHDLSIDEFVTNVKYNTVTPGEELEANLHCAQNIATSIKEEMTKGMPGRLIYIAPWAWNRLADPIRYETVRAGTVALTRSMSAMLAPYRVNVNCIIPGFIKTLSISTYQKDRADALSREIPFGHLGEISDITETILFLMGNESKYLSGQVLELTGGIYQHSLDPKN